MATPTNDQTPKLLELITLLQEQNAKLESRVKELGAVPLLRRQAAIKPDF